MAELDEDLLWLLADDIDFVDIGDAQQPLTNVFNARLELGEARPVGAHHATYRRVDVAILVVEGWSDDLGRQVAPDVADLLADLVPEVFDLCGRRLVDQKDLDKRHARLRIRFDAVEIGQFLQLLFDFVRDLGLHLRSPWRRARRH